MLNLEMNKAIVIIYQILKFFFICMHNNVGRDRDWTILAPVLILIPLKYGTCTTKPFLGLNSNFLKLTKTMGTGI